MDSLLSMTLTQSSYSTDNSRRYGGGRLARLRFHMSRLTRSPPPSSSTSLSATPSQNIVETLLNGQQSAARSGNRYECQICMELFRTFSFDSLAPDDLQAVLTQTTQVADDEHSSAPLLLGTDDMVFHDNDEISFFESVDLALKARRHEPYQHAAEPAATLSSKPSRLPLVSRPLPPIPVESAQAYASPPLPPPPGTEPNNNNNCVSTLQTPRRESRTAVPVPDREPFQAPILDALARPPPNSRRMQQQQQNQQPVLSSPADTQPAFPTLQPSSPRQTRTQRFSPQPLMLAFYPTTSSNTRTPDLHSSNAALVLPPSPFTPRRLERRRAIRQPSPMEPLSSSPPHPAPPLAPPFGALPAVQNIQDAYLKYQRDYQRQRLATVQKGIARQRQHDEELQQRALELTIQEDLERERLSRTSGSCEDDHRGGAPSSSSRHEGQAKHIALILKSSQQEATHPSRGGVDSSSSSSSSGSFHTAPEFLPSNPSTEKPACMDLTAQEESSQQEQQSSSIFSSFRPTESTIAGTELLNKAASISLSSALVSPSMAADASVLSFDSTLHSANEDQDIKLGYAFECHPAHAYCLECLFGYLNGAVRARRWPISCPGIGCEVEIEYSVVEAVLGPDAADWYELGVEHGLKNKIYCPNPKCSLILEGEETPDKGKGKGKDAKGEAFNCPYCRHYFCISCLEPGHPGKTCSEANETEQQRGDRLFEELISQKHWKRCPRCTVVVEKTSGCNHMTCSKCSWHFCYACGNNYPCNAH